MEWDRIDYCKWESHDYGHRSVAFFAKKGSARVRIYKKEGGHSIRTFGGGQILDVMKEAKEFLENLQKSENKFVVFYDGKPVLKLNEKLIETQKCEENLEKIKNLHVERLEIEEEMRKETDQIKLIVWNEEYTQIEFELQKAWKFEQDKNFHRFWNRPKCSCPKMDNEDRYPTGNYIVSRECKLHGDF